MTEAQQTQKPLVEIPYVDVRKQGPLGLLLEHKPKIVALLNGSVSMYGLTAKILGPAVLPAVDSACMEWLKKTNNPYRAEIADMAYAVGKNGLVALNLCYEWGCTTGVVTKDQGPALGRILDWPYPQLGENLVIAHQQGPAGDFHNITWPGLSGTFNAFAQGRFAAAINQAPMRRHGKSVTLDWIRNRSLVKQSDALPPAHLLRKTFEQAHDYAEAKKMLTEEPVAIPVFFTLSGTKPGEGCVIERTETAAGVREMSEGRVFVSNHFESHLKDASPGGWMLTAEQSHERLAQACALPAADISPAFDWFKAPIANAESRLVFLASAASGDLAVMGTDGARPVTKTFRL